MVFAVNFKGVRCYRGRLASAYRYIEQKWGSLAAAWAVGVKVLPLAGP
jgi:hypothetical protein